jgi:hypothetical protein
MEYLKLSEEVAADIKARVKSLDIGAIEKLRKAGQDSGTFDVIISTEDLDRAGEIVRQNGWELSNYKNNPIVLWGHDYYSLPIGICTETYKTQVHGVPATGAKGVFYPADINPFAQQVRRMYEFGTKAGVGVGCTTSVGFIPKEYDNENGRIITRAELLEFSFVPIPANQGVGPAQGRALTVAEARSLGLDMVGLRSKGLDFNETLGIVPKDISTKTAPENTAWKKPTLSDFTEKAWEELSEADQREIAGHFAYAPESPAKSFEDLQLAHHRADDGAAVWKAVKAAINALVDAVDVEGDRKAVYDHLAAHYREFGKEVPEFKTLKEAQAGDECTMDDGTTGVLTADPKDPDGPLVCMPQESQDAKAESGRTSEKALLKAISDEHQRHTGETEKAIDAFSERAAEGEDEKAISEAAKDLRTSLADEQTMHRAKAIACFRTFKPAEDKAFDTKPHLKALRENEDAYEAAIGKTLDDFEEHCSKHAKPEDADSLAEFIAEKLEAIQRAHKKDLSKIAKTMCKAAFGEPEEADAQTLEILKEFLTPHIDAQLLPAVISPRTFACSRTSSRA